MRKLTIKTWIIAGALSLLPLAVHGAGLGKLTVVSALGEPLNAQIELLSVKKEELSSITARLASPEQFKQTNLEYGAIHARLKLGVETRPDGQSYIKLTSREPVQEPFLAILVELSWSSGRLLREYTFLLDPPGFDARESIATAAPPLVAPPVAAVSEKPMAAAAEVPASTKPMAEAVAPPAARTWPVKRGDTLSKVAIGVKPEGVSLDQMLVALYRANRKAFIGNNMNRLKTGPILQVPDSSELASIDAKEARKEVRVQAADWNAYLQKLAAVAASGAPAAAPQQTVAGKITTTVEDKAAVAPAKEVLKLSKGEAPGDKAAGATDAKSLQARVHAMEEESTAKGKALKEASERVALLEKNIQEMQKLLELKNQTLAEAQKAKPAAQPALPAAEAPKTAKPVEQPLAEVKPEATPAQAPQPEAAKPEVKPAVKKPAPKSVASPVRAEKNLVDEFLDNPVYIAVIVGALAVLIGVGFLALRRKKSPAAEAAEQPGEEMKTIIVPAPVAFPQEEKAQKSAPAPTDEVDPIAEAEVYLTYGRDVQAEEILKEALSKNVSRHEVHLKLLEIYFNRKDRAAFEAAAQRFQAAGGSGPEWERVINMGVALDPANPFYAGGVAAPGTAVAPDVDIGQAPGKVDFDFDLDLGAPAAAPQAQPVEAAAVKAESMAMDFDITALADEVPKPAAAAPAIPAPAPPGSEDIVFDITALPPEVEVPAPAAALDAGMDFKLDADEPIAAPASETASETEAISFGDISLDLGETQKPEAAGGGESHDAHWQEVATKFDLAKAYQEMGDKDGAREILDEVLREGDARQQEAAKALLASL